MQYNEKPRSEIVPTAFYSVSSVPIGVDETLLDALKAESDQMFSAICTNDRYQLRIYQKGDVDNVLFLF